MSSGIYIRTEAQKEAMRKAQNRPDVKEKISKSRKEAWKDSEKRENIVNALNRLDVKEKKSKSEKRAQNRPDVKEKRRQYMINGGSAHSTSFIKNPSKQGVKFRETVLKIYPSAISEFRILNYKVDAAIEEYKIALEYDGWHHFKDQESINYHNKRQEEIEREGWKFIRYNIFQKFPAQEQIKEDIETLSQKILSFQNYLA